MKKLISILIISLFLLSVVSAEYDEKKDEKEDILDAREDKYDDSQQDLNDCVKRCNEAGKSNCKEECKAWDLREDKKDYREDRADKKEDILDAREDKKDKLENIRDKKEDYKKIRELETEEKLEKVKELKKEDFREYQKGKLMTAVDKCREKELDKELCEKKFEKRIDLVDKLKEKDLERLKKQEERKIEKEEEKKEFKKDPKLSKYKEEKEFKAREIAKEKLEKAKEDYKEAKEDYKEVKKEYIDSKKEFADKKEELDKCKDEDSEKCQQLMEEINEKARDFLLATADKILEHLEKVKAKVEGNEELSEEEATEILADLDDMIDEIEASRTTIEFSKNKKEVQDAARTIKHIWERIRGKLAIHTGKIFSSEIGYTIMKMKNVEATLERALARMEENSIDTTEIQLLIDDINELIDQAKDGYSAALDKFEEAAEAEDHEAARALIEEGNRYLKQVHVSLIEARDILNRVIEMIRNAGGADELTASEDEIEEEIENEETTTEVDPITIEEEVPTTTEPIAT